MFNNGHMTIALVYMRHAFSQENRDYHIIRRTENISSQITVTKLESSHSTQVPPPRQSYSPKASPSSVLQRFPYAPFNAVVTKISKWSRIQDSCRITPKIESLVAVAMRDIFSKFQKDPSITFWVILLTDRQTDRQTKTSKNITSLPEVNMFYAVLYPLLN